MNIEKLKEIFGEWPLRVGQFYKVSYDQFRKDWLDTFSEAGDTELREEDVIKDAYDTLALPVRSDDGSAGHDMYSPLDFVLDPGDEIKIPTGIKVQMLEGWYLMCVPRSGMGFKYYVRNANTIGVIDASYYNNKDNEGHCYIKIRNEGMKRMEVHKGDRFCQAIFHIHGITEDDNASGERSGGIGSTGR